MLHDAKLPTYFWAEVINTACYTQNRTLINKTHGNTPYYLLNGKKPTVKYFHMFGSKCFMMKDNHEKKGKFDTKAYEGIFMGYALERSAYRVYLLEHRVIDESVNVTFDETKFPGLHEEGQMQILRFENQGYLEEEEIVDEEPNFTQTVETEKNAVIEVDANQTPAQSQTITGNTQLMTRNLPRTTRWNKDHTNDLIIGDPSSGVRTRNNVSADSMFSCFLSQMEPKAIDEALLDSDWVIAIQEELNQFERNNEGIDYDETFAPVARLEAIRIFLAFSAHYAKMYDFVYKLFKALYGLKQAPRAWYDTLSAFLLENQFTRGVVDKTLFYKHHGKDVILVQIYVDDIIFGSSNEKLCEKFSSLMRNKYEMSMMGELSFFLGLQVLQKDDEIFICQANLDLDSKGKKVDSSAYMGMVGSLLYLTASRPDIMFATYLCARFRVDPKESHLVAIKRIFRYLKGTHNLGLWYPKNTGFDLVGYSDSEYAGCRIDRKSTTGSCQFLGGRLVSWFSKKQHSVSTSTAEAEYIAAGICCAQILWMKNQLLDYGLVLNNIPIYCDNTSAIAISDNPVQHSRTKHIDIRHHFIREYVERGTVNVRPNTQYIIKLSMIITI
ncbi:hypothetical protein POM88_039545 [Heracleum sosnowskyi]|uniref:Reverse transcriptase Ty1/copia-type domain-containing protein n=1 Tax=Heracleum sosnowskyi TaxID=360622 RepID=A0AAD8HBD9_9APIA|nr:hypothetical protein POM88_039545 [Heracleum sosnowskyi]